MKHARLGSIPIVLMANYAIRIPRVVSEIRFSVDQVGWMLPRAVSSRAQVDPQAIVQRISYVFRQLLVMRFNLSSVVRILMMLMTNAVVHACQVEVAIAKMAKGVSHTHSVVQMGRMPSLLHLFHQFHGLHQNRSSAVPRMMMLL